MPNPQSTQAADDTACKFYLASPLPSGVRPLVIVDAGTPVTMPNDARRAQHFILLPGETELQGAQTYLQARMIQHLGLSDAFTTGGLLNLHRGLALEWLNRRNAELLKDSPRPLPLVTLEEVDPFDLTYLTSHLEVFDQVEKAWQESDHPTLNKFFEFLRTLKKWRASSRSVEHFNQR